MNPDAMMRPNQTVAFVSKLPVELMELRASVVRILIDRNGTVPLGDLPHIDSTTKQNAEKWCGKNLMSTKKGHLIKALLACADGAFGFDRRITTDIHLHLIQ